MEVATKYQKPKDNGQDQLERIKKNIEVAISDFRENTDRFHYFMKFIYKSGISANDISVNSDLKRPSIECPVLEAYISRQIGEFARQEPSIETSGAENYEINPQIVEAVDGYFRGLLRRENNELFEHRTWKNMLSGGYSVAKVFTEYADERSFKQVIRVKACDDVTQCFFDPMARNPDKSDGNYCFERFPKRKTDIENEYGVNLDNVDFLRSAPELNWFYMVGEEKIVMLCDYYEKKPVNKTLVKLSDGRLMLEDEYKDEMKRWRKRTLKGLEFRPAPTIADSRPTTVDIICRYVIIGNKVLDYTETDLPGLPLVFFDGNSVTILGEKDGKTQQMTRPLVYQARDMQRFKNCALQSFANELENMVQHKWMMPKESIAVGYDEALKNNQLPSVIVYNQFKNDNPDIRLDPPQAVPRVPMPPEILSAFTIADESIKMILGLYDASLGINDNQLSGSAIMQGAMQSNAAVMPFRVGFMSGLNRIAQMVVDLIPKYLKEPQALPIVTKDGQPSAIKINGADGLNLQYPTNALQIKVEAGVNFAVQKQMAMQQLISLMQASPIFAQFMNVEGLPILLDNLEIRGVDQLKALSKQFMQQMQQQQQQQAQQPNPMQLKQQELQLKQSDQQIKLQQMQQDAIDSQRQAQIDYARLGEAEAKRKHDSLDKLQDRLIDVEALQSEKEKTHGQQHLQAQDMAHQHAQNLMETLMAHHDMNHKHAHDKASLSFQVEQANKPQPLSQGA